MESEGQVEKIDLDDAHYILMAKIAALYEDPEEAFDALHECVEKLQTTLPPLDDENVDEISHVLSCIDMHQISQHHDKSYFDKVDQYTAQLKNNQLQITTFLIELLEKEREMHRRRVQFGTPRTTGLLKHHLEVLTVPEATNLDGHEPIPMEPSPGLDEHLRQLIRTSCRMELAQIMLCQKAN